MGFLFTVRHDWSGERFTPQIAVTARVTIQINTPNPLGDEKLLVQKWPEVFLRVALCCATTRKKHGQPVSLWWKVGAAYLKTYLLSYGFLKSGLFHNLLLHRHLFNFILWLKWPVCLQQIKLLKDLKAHAELLNYDLHDLSEIQLLMTHTNWLINFTCWKFNLLGCNVDVFTFFENRFEHPAGGYKKIFETCDELSEALPATVTGLFAYFRQK